MTRHDHYGPKSALLDACVLVPIRLTSTMLWLAESHLFGVLWSETILDEVQRSLPKLGVSNERAAMRVKLMRDAFGAAAMVSDFEDLIPEMRCDTKDRHVLAAAVKGDADLLVTFNLKDFPLETMEEQGVEAVHPDVFLTGLCSVDIDEVVAALELGVATLRRPPATLGEFLMTLTPTVPTFAALVAVAAGAT